MHHAAACERHRLAVIAGARAAGRDRHVMGIAGAQHLDHLGLVPGPHHEIGGDMVEPRLQDRRIPEEVAAGRADRGFLCLDIEMRKRGLGGSNSVFHGVSINGSSSA
jgi:hypothetical protein